MKVKLLHHTPLWVAGMAIRTCWASGDKSDTLIDGAGKVRDTTVGQLREVECGTKDKALIERVGNKFKHKSTLEHLDYNFFISGISRAVLQELARHRTASLSVKSSRYTLKELKDDPMVGDDLGSTIPWAEKYVVFTGDPYVNGCIVDSLNNLQKQLARGTSNDIAKYCMPEAYKTELTWTMDARNLQHFLSLRTDKAALKEIRELAHNIFEALPEEHKYLFRDYVKIYDNKENENDSKS